MNVLRENKQVGGLQSSSILYMEVYKLPHISKRSWGSVSMIKMKTVLIWKVILRKVISRWAIGHEKFSDFSGAEKLAIVDEEFSDLNGTEKNDQTKAQIETNGSRKHQTSEFYCEKIEAKAK